MERGRRGAGPVTRGHLRAQGADEVANGLWRELGISRRDLEAANSGKVRTISVRSYIVWSQADVVQHPSLQLIELPRDNWALAIRVPLTSNPGMPCCQFSEIWGEAHCTNNKSIITRP